MTQETLTVFFGWLTAINFGLLMFGTVAMLFMRDFAVKLHGKMFKMDEKELNKAYFQYLSLDQGANPANLINTNAAEIQVGGPPR